MMSISKREKSMLIIAITAVVIFGSYHIVAKPLLRWRQSQAATIVELETVLLRYRASVRQKDLIQERYKAMAVDLRQQGSNEEEIARLLQELRRKYSSLPLTDKGTKVLPVEDGQFYRKFRISMELEGTMPVLADFLYMITTASQPLRIEQMNLRATGSEGGPEAVRGSIILSAVYIPPPEQRKP